jgi:hypothetical protein
MVFIEVPLSGPAFLNGFAAKLRCIGFDIHAAFLIALLSKYAASGARLSRAVCGRSALIPAGVLYSDDRLIFSSLRWRVRLTAV